jgi:hypothetical protein
MSTQEVALNPATTALGFKKRVEELDAAIKRFSELASPEDYQTVAAYGLKAADLVKEAEAFYKAEIAKLHGLWRGKCDERAAITDPAEHVKNIAARLCGAWQAKQEEIRRQQELEEQNRQHKLAEDNALEEAALLEKQGFHEEAEAVLETPVTSTPVSIPSTVPRMRGVTKPRDNWKANVTSLKLLVKAVAEGKVPLQAIEANESFLNNQARVMKLTLNYPGVSVKNDVKSAFRS